MSRPTLRGRGNIVLPIVFIVLGEKVCSDGQVYSVRFASAEVPKTAFWVKIVCKIMNLPFVLPGIPLDGFLVPVLSINVMFAPFWSFPRKRPRKSSETTG